MAQAMTAQDALHALRDLPRYEERLTARAGGLTFMLWGLATAGIFTTYAAAAEPLEARGAYWAFGVLWVPWTAAGIAASAALWSSHAVTMRRAPGAREGLRQSLLFTFGFLALAAALFAVLDLWAGVEWDVNGVLAVASGLFAILVGLLQRKAWGPGARNVAVAGACMVLAGVALGVSGTGGAAAAFTAAAVVGSGWFLAGVATYARG